jgi:hypothetical protein
LIEWIADGSVLPADKVRRGNLRWIEAAKVPILAQHFRLPRKDGQGARSNAESKQASGSQREFEPVAQLDVCRIHSDRDAFYMCPGCGGSFCRDCPKSYGGNVRICPVCGGMCKQRQQAVADQVYSQQFQRDMNAGFGFKDLGAALEYPFRFKTSLFFGALMFAFFSLGRSASAVGGIFMFAASLSSVMLANMLTFGVLAHTVERFAQGKIGGNFMPDFDDFNIWDDVVHPFFLSIGVYVSSLGPLVITAGIGFYMVFSSLSAQSATMNRQIESLPATDYFDTHKTVKQSQDVKKVLGTVEDQTNERLKLQEQIESGRVTQTTAGVPDTEKTVTEADELIKDGRKKQLESIAGRSPIEKEKELGSIIRSFVSLAAPLVVLSAIALLWAMFYFPVACAVAGYTRSFSATVNPIVGLDTVRRLGTDYVKLLGMSLLLLMASSMIAGLANLVFAPFELPIFGNLPAMTIGFVVTFYFSVVFSCLIGFALYKASPRLKLYH